MSIKKYVHLDDQSIAAGGTNLTSMAILENRIDDIVSISCQDLTLEKIKEHKNKLWIIGNISNLYKLPENIIDELLSESTFVKIEFDYNFCPYRGEIPHERLGNRQCKCPYEFIVDPVFPHVYDLIIKNAKHCFFMSERQRSIYSTHLPLMQFDKTSILSSCFMKSSLDLIKACSSNSKNDIYAILQGYGGWHSEAKGVTEARNFCDANNMPCQILPNQPYKQHIETLSQFKGMVFLPIIHDTCPRCIIEAKLLDLDVYTNMNSQHITESWWKKPLDEIEEYIKSRPFHFWRTVDENCNINAC